MKSVVRQRTRQQYQGESWPERGNKPGSDVLKDRSLQAEAWLRATLTSIPTSGPRALLDTTIQSIDRRLILCAL